MFGFVYVTPLISKWLPTKTVHLTLEEEVLAAGLRVIPLDRVRAYQRKAKLEWEAQSPVNRAWWERVEAQDIKALEPPPDVARHIETAQTIKGTRVYAEKFEEDPFIFIKRIGLDEPVCFGYFNAPGFVA